MWVIAQFGLLAVLGAAILIGGTPLLPTGPLTRLLAAAMLFIPLSIVLWSWRWMGPAFRVSPIPRDGVPLVTVGPYRHFRHPMYTAACTGAIGLFVLRPTVAVALLVAVVIGFYVLKGRYEESLLAIRHPAYAAYRAGTYGVIPLRRG